MFEALDGGLYFTAQWYYRANDTVSYPFYVLFTHMFLPQLYLTLNFFLASQVIKQLGNLIEPKRVFFSEVQDDNPLDCLVEKLTIARLELKVCCFVFGFLCNYFS